MKKIIVFVMLVIASSISIKMLAQQPAVILSDKEGWHKIGETIVDFKMETDEIIVIGADRFAFVKIKVADAPIDLMSFEIFFESGDNQIVPIGKIIKIPGETRVVELKGGERSIKKITFKYKTAPNSKDKKPHVELWGMKTNLDKKTK